MKKVIKGALTLIVPFIIKAGVILATSLLIAVVVSFFTPGITIPVLFIIVIVIEYLLLGICDTLKSVGKRNIIFIEKVRKELEEKRRK